MEPAGDDLTDTPIGYIRRWYYHPLLLFPGLAAGIDAANTSHLYLSRGAKAETFANAGFRSLER